jgi:hypothetical protein
MAPSAGGGRCRRRASKRCGGSTALPCAARRSQRRRQGRSANDARLDDVARQRARGGGNTWDRLLRLGTLADGGALGVLLRLASSWSEAALAERRGYSCEAWRRQLTRARRLLLAGGSARSRENGVSRSVRHGGAGREDGKERWQVVPWHSPRGAACSLGEAGRLAATRTTRQRLGDSSTRALSAPGRAGPRSRAAGLHGSWATETRTGRRGRKGALGWRGALGCAWHGSPRLGVGRAGCRDGPRGALGRRG